MRTRRGWGWGWEWDGDWGEGALAWGGLWVPIVPPCPAGPHSPPHYHPTTHHPIAHHICPRQAQPGAQHPLLGGTHLAVGWGLQAHGDGPTGQTGESRHRGQWGGHGALGVPVGRWGHRVVAELAAAVEDHDEEGDGYEDDDDDDEEHDPEDTERRVLGAGRSPPPLLGTLGCLPPPTDPPSPVPTPTGLTGPLPDPHPTAPIPRDPSWAWHPLQVAPGLCPPPPSPPANKPRRPGISWHRRATLLARARLWTRVPGAPCSLRPAPRCPLHPPCPTVDVALGGGLVGGTPAVGQFGVS